MLLLAVVFLVAVALPEVVDLDAEWLLALDYVTWIVWAAFAFALVVKTYLAPNRRRYLLARWMDVISVLVPFLRPRRWLVYLAERGVAVFLMLVGISLFGLLSAEAPLRRWE